LGRSLLKQLDDKLKFELDNLSWLSEEKSDDPILSEAQFKSIEKYAHDAERVFVAAITPLLSELLENVTPSCVLVNSEEIPWIPVENGNADNQLKPDLFMVPECVFEAHERTTKGKSEAFKKAEEVREENSKRGFKYLFGKCPPLLRDSVFCLFEAKRRIGTDLHDALGEIFPKLQHLYTGAKVREYQCVLFDPQQLYLLRFDRRVMLSMHHLRWTTPKSRSFFLRL
jgi:hypothetical protein